MNSILEKLFMGEFDAMEFLPVRNEIPSPDIDAFAKYLTPERQEQFKESMDRLMKQWLLSNQDCFIIGFKTAIRVILESITDTPRQTQNEE